jgi:hypothetical protein
MASESTLSQQILGVLSKQKTPKSQDKKRARKPKTNKTTLGESSVTSPMQQHGELPGDAEPKKLSPAKVDRERVINHARDAKVRATQDWVEGRMPTDQHERVHKRANHVLSKKSPQEFKGKTGERAPKGRLPW